MTIAHARVALETVKEHPRAGGEALVASRPRVLVVAARDPDAEAIAVEIRRAGFDLAHRRVAGDEGLVAALDEGPWDLVIARHEPPGLDGLAPLRRLRERDLDTPLLLVSASPGEETAVAAMRAGAHDYLLERDLSRLGPKVVRALGDAEARRNDRRAEESRRFLADAGASLAESLDHAATLQRVAQLAVQGIADWCLVDVVERGAIRRLAVAHADPARAAEAAELVRFPADPGAPAGVARVIRTGAPELHPDAAPVWDEARDPAHRRVLASLGASSLMVVPMATEGAVLGTISLVAARPGRRHEARDLDLAMELARRAAVAVDHARVHRHAQQAIRLRDEFLSVTAHELRTPLTPLQLQVHSLQLLLDGGRTVEPKRLASGLAVADRQVKRLTQLIGHLLDVIRIDTGRLALTLSELDLAALTRDVVGRFEAELERAECRLAIVAPQPVVGTWDRQRLEHVVVNLVGNAMVYGAGRPIEVSVLLRGDHALLAVGDHGQGIAPEDQERIFERYERLAPKIDPGGLGLGLWIVRHIVEELRGRVRVDSRPGAGATFTVTLPRHPRPEGAQA